MFRRHISGIDQYRVIKRFRDRETDETYVPGDIITPDAERARYLEGRGFIERVNSHGDTNETDS